MTGKTRKILYFSSMLIVVAVIAVTTFYILSFLTQPKYDFIYSRCAKYPCDIDFTVDKESEMIVMQPTKMHGTGEVATLYYYTESNDSTRTIDYFEAASYRVDSSSKSPDGYVFTQNRRDGNFLWWNTTTPTNVNDGKWHLRKGLLSKEIELEPIPGRAVDKVRFLGWVQ